jgi:hypothetical protein
MISSPRLHSVHKTVDLLEINECEVMLKEAALAYFDLQQHPLPGRINESYEKDYMKIASLQAAICELQKYETTVLPTRLVDMKTELK